MIDYQKYLQTVGDVAVQIATPAEAFRLLDWIQATMPDAKGADVEVAYDVLATVVAYWNDHGLYEDMLCPILGVLHALQALCPDGVNITHIARISELNAEMLNADAEDSYEDCSYEEFCDKYAEDLNR